MATVPTSEHYAERRAQLSEYFDRTAFETWARLTSDAPLRGIRATVRAGREAMRATLLAWLPQDLSGARVLDAGCGTGQLAVELARRGAQVVAVDLSPRLIALARARHAQTGGVGRIEFRVGDMLVAAPGDFDYVVAMDSLIHYAADDIVRALAQWAPRTARSQLVTFAPRTPLLTLMHALGRLLPRGQRAPAIQPVSDGVLRARLTSEAALAAWTPMRCARIARGFYVSQALQLVRR